MKETKVFVGGRWRKKEDLPYPSEVRRVLREYKDKVIGAGEDRKRVWDRIFKRELGCSCAEAMKVLE